MITLNNPNYKHNSYPSLLAESNINSELLELPNFISSLISLPPDQIMDMNDLKRHIHLMTEDSIKISPTLIHYIKNLIFNQFPDIKYCIREIVSNALDSHVRVKHFDKPILLNLEGDKLILEDEGDGMDWSSLLSFLIPGRSSNSKAIFNLSEGIPQVTGRFGQGVLAIFSLIYALPSDTRCVPHFFEENGIHRLELTYYIGEDKTGHNLLIDPETIVEKPQDTLQSGQRKISIHTFREGKKPLKMKFSAIGDKIFLKDIKEKPKDKIGTTFKISSPMIKQNQKNLVSYLTKTFKHISIPFFINQALINASNHKTLHVNGGALHYTPQDKETSEGGTLRVCEKGRLIAEFVMEKGLVPKEMTVNFDQLPLTHDRSTLDFKDVNSITVIESILDKIWTSEMSLQEKGALLNGLFPIIGKKQYHLIKKIKDLISNDDIPFLPDSTDFRALNDSKGLYLNPHYFSSLPFPAFFKGEGYTLYFLTTSSHKPVAAFSCDGQTHIFLNDQLFSKNLKQLQYNLSLLNEWLWNKDEKILVDVKKIMHQLQFSQTHKTQSTPIVNEVKAESFSSYGLDWKKYDLLSDEELSEFEALIFLASCQYTQDLKMQQGAQGYLLQRYCDRIYEGLKKSENPSPTNMRYFYLKPKYLAELKITQNALMGISKQDIEYFNSHVTLNERKTIEAIEKITERNLTKKMITYFIDTTRSSTNSFLNFFLTKSDFFNSFSFLINKKRTTLEKCHIAMTSLYSNCMEMSEETQNAFLDLVSDIRYIFEIDNFGNFILKKEILENFISFRKLMELAYIDNLKQLEPRDITNFDSNLFYYDLKKCLSTYPKSAFNQLQILIKDLPTTIQIELLQAFVGGGISHLEWLTSLSSESLEKFLRVFFSINMPWSIEKKDHSLSENDYQNILSISQKDHLSLYAKQLFARLFFLSINERKSTAQSVINTQHFADFLSHLIDEEDVSDLQEIENVYLEMLKFQKNTRKVHSMICFFSHALKKFTSQKLKKYAHTQSQPLQRLNKKNIELCIKELEKIGVTPFKNFTLKESIEIVIQIHQLRIQKNINALRKLYHHLWEKSELISSTTRPYIYAMLSQETKNFINQTFTFPITLDPAMNIYLHEDVGVLKELYPNEYDKNDISNASKKERQEYAKRRIQSALKQTTSENSFIGEFSKNSREAGATKLNFELHTTEDEETVLLVEDNGCGMGPEELNILKTPNVTKKMKSADDPNFGWGFFTVFRDFDEILISTTKDGQTRYYLYFKKTEKGILTQQSKIEKPSNPGTTFMLKKASGSKPLIDFVKLKAEIISKCQYMQDIDLSFQKQSVSINKKPTIFHEETDGENSIQLGLGDEGIYCGDIKIGPIPSNYTSLLPNPLKKMLEEKEIKLRLFIPHTKQIMNRNQSMMEEEFSDQARALIFTALFHFYLKQFTPNGLKENDDMLKILSEDYWDLFNQEFQQTPEQLSVMIQAIEGKKWELLTTQPNKEIRMKILDAACEFFSNFSESANLSLGTPDGAESAESFLSNILKKDDMKSRKEAMKILSTKLSNPSLFAELLTHTPLSPLDPSSSFIAIRNEWQYVLVNENLLQVDGDYNSDLIKNCSEQELINRINRCQQIVWQLLSKNDQEYSKKINQKFAESIFWRCIAFKNQSEGTEENEVDHVVSELSPESKKLAQFCQQIAQRFEREIEVSFYSKVDGADAYTKNGLNTIFINQLGDCLQNFVKLHNMPLEETETLNEQQMELIIDIIETITHELVHLNESTDCESTHDVTFRNQLAIFFESLFIRNDTPEKSVLKMLGI